MLLQLAGKRLKLPTRLRQLFVAAYNALRQIGNALSVRLSPRYDAFQLHRTRVRLCSRLTNTSVQFISAGYACRVLSVHAFQVSSLRVNQACQSRNLGLRRALLRIHL